MTLHSRHFISDSGSPHIWQWSATFVLFNVRFLITAIFSLFVSVRLCHIQIYLEFDKLESFLCVITRTWSRVSNPDVQEVAGRAPDRGVRGVVGGHGTSFWSPGNIPKHDCFPRFQWVRNPGPRSGRTQVGRPIDNRHRCVRQGPHSAIGGTLSSDLPKMARIPGESLAPAQKAGHPTLPKVFSQSLRSRLH
jgi:hypothetical protein